MEVSNFDLQSQDRIQNCRLAFEQGRIEVRTAKTCGWRGVCQLCLYDGNKFT